MDNTECCCDDEYTCVACEKRAESELSDGDKRTNQLMHFITGGDFL